MSEVTVRRATMADLEEVVSVLGGALEENVLIRYLVRPDKQRGEAVRRLLREFGQRYYLPAGASWVAEQGDAIVGAAFVAPPAGKTGYGLRDSLRAMRQTIRITRLRGLWRAGQAGGFLNYIHPRTPHFYLYQVGASAEVGELEGKAIVDGLLRAVTERADEAGMPIYAESAEESVLETYTRHRFELKDAAALPGGPTLQLFWRSPVE